MRFMRLGGSLAASNRGEADTLGAVPAWRASPITSVLARRPRTRAARYLISTLLVGLFFLLVVLVQGSGRPECFFILLPAIFLAAVTCGGDCGIYAALSSGALLYGLVLPPHDIVLPGRFVPALVIFLVAALGLAALSDALRSAWDRASAAERAKDLLLRELSHRTKNSLAMLISALSLQLRSKANREVQAALQQALDRAVAIASAHEFFRADALDNHVEMRAYLEKLCAHFNHTLRGVRPIAVRVDADAFYLGSEQAVAAGLIVNELVTNALKYAFPEGRGGTVNVVLRSDPVFSLVIEDNGVGYVAEHENQGSKLTRLLAQQLGATIERENAAPGCRVRIRQLVA